MAHSVYVAASEVVEFQEGVIHSITECCHKIGIKKSYIVDDYVRQQMFGRFSSKFISAKLLA